MAFRLTRERLRAIMNEGARAVGKRYVDFFAGRVRNETDPEFRVVD